MRDWLKDRMFDGDSNAQDKIDKIVKDLASHSNSLNHTRHYSAQQCKNLGLKVSMMEEDQELQDAVLSVHHATMHTISNSSAAPIFKIIENHLGAAMVTT